MSGSDALRERRRLFLAGQAQRLEQRIDVRRRVERRYPWLRLAAFLLGVAGAVLAFQVPPAWLRWAWLALFAAGFGALTLAHRRVIDSITRYEALLAFSKQQAARMALDWPGIPAPPAFAPEKDHPFELDLNITGGRSLLHLLDTAVSLGGSRRLRDWLLAREPDVALARQRQAQAAALRERPAFRARLRLAGASTSADGRPWDGEALLAWLQTHRDASSYTPLLIALGVLALINAGLFALNVAGVLPAYWVFGLFLFWGLQGIKYRETSELFTEAYSLGRALDRFRAVLAEIETARIPPGDPLAALTAPLRDQACCPSRLLRRLAGIISAAGLRSNPFLGLFLNSILPWDLYFSARLEAYKRELAGVLPAWLDTWYQLEALISLANYSLIAPESSQPVFIAPGGESALRAERIGHPLIPYEARVCNDFTVEALGGIAIVTGSNMSGKSTFLRTLGVNLALAQAGGTVCAAALASLPFRLYTSINVSDSLSDGVSYFYAEVRRLKGLLDALEQPRAAPLFFLIDEIFRGTNNRERRIGSTAYTQALAGKAGTGVISTHDLELARLADEIGGVRNYHFREDIIDGRMVFDYRLRPGPSPTTNALKIMALEGLPVEPKA